MRIFLKNINTEEIRFIHKFPIQGIIFSINQENAEKIRDIIKKLPPFITVIGEISSLSKYEIEEIIYFCKLQGVIIPESESYGELSCPIIYSKNTEYNALVTKKNEIYTDEVNFLQLEESRNIFGLVFNIDDFFNNWYSILNIWSNIKVV